MIKIHPLDKYQKDKAGKLPLHYAAMKGCTAIIELYTLDDWLLIDSTKIVLPKTEEIKREFGSKSIGNYMGKNFGEERERCLTPLSFTDEANLYL